MSWLLLRGLGREQRHWQDFPARLRGAVAPEPVFVLDLAGAGTERGRVPRPSVPWLARDVRRRLESHADSQGRWNLIGLSLGGMVALELCRTCPSDVQGAIIINSSSRLSRAPARFRIEALRRLASASTRSSSERERAVLELTSQLPLGRHASVHQLNALWAREAPMSCLAFAIQLLAAARFVPPPPDSVAARLLFLSSCGDRLVDPGCTRDLARLYRAPSEEHPWAGHDLPLDDPDWLCERVLHFVTKASRVVA
jgi:pimeloyl-ACP methyl ester carboxylesterase